MLIGQFSQKDFIANTPISLKLSSGDSVSGEISALNENNMELITSTKESARKILIAYAHIVYIEQVKIPTQVPAI